MLWSFFLPAEGHGGNAQVRSGTTPQLPRLQKILKLVLPLLLIAAVVLVTLPCLGADSGGARDRVLESLKKTGMPGMVSALLISTLPIFELRGGIPVAINYFKIQWWLAYIVCVIGNMIPVVPILLFLGGVSKALSRFALSRRFFDWLFSRTRKRGGIVEKYRSLGLVLFVAIPLPVTGAWTGSVAAFLFGMRLAPSFLYIFFGVLVAGVIVTVLSLLGVLGGILAGVGLLLVATWSVLRAKGRKPR